MTPLDEARVQVRKTLKEIIRVETLYRRNQSNLPLNDMDESFMRGCENRFEDMMAKLEEAFRSATAGVDQNDVYKQAHIYYNLYAMILTNCVIGFSLAY